MDKFFENPFSLNQLRVYSIYRCLSPANFFVQFQHNKMVSNGQIISTLYNGLCESIAVNPTNWHPTFDQMKIMLIICSNVNVNYSDEERETLYKSDALSINFSYFNFEDKELKQRKKYDIIIDNKNEEIWLNHFNA